MAKECKKCGIWNLKDEEEDCPICNKKLTVDKDEL